LSSLVVRMVYVFEISDLELFESVLFRLDHFGSTQLKLFAYRALAQRFGSFVCVSGRFIVVIALFIIGMSGWLVDLLFCWWSTLYL